MFLERYCESNGRDEALEGWRAGLRIPEAERKKPPSGGFLIRAGGTRTYV
ncbi:hypothetical protein N9954_06830 [Maribacter sp.]|nr:hypothetical protein [Maribacter sp.]